MTDKVALSSKREVHPVVIRSGMLFNDGAYTDKARWVRAEDYERVTAELSVLKRQQSETTELHWPLIDTALSGAAKALPVLFTMLTKAGLREGAMVADEINGNVLCAIKQLSHGRRPPLKATAELTK